MSNLEVIVRSTPIPNSIKTEVQKHFCQINKINNRIINCKLVIDALTNPSVKNKIYVIKIIANVSDKEFISKKHHHDLNNAIHSGFSSIQSLLKEYFNRNLHYFNKRATKKNLDRIAHIL
jgi:ribosome-associated translation inhibitor RaiA